MKEEIYELTPKGWANDEAKKKTLDNLLLYFVKTGYNALVWSEDERKWMFAKVTKPKRGKKNV